MLRFQLLLPSLLLVQVLGIAQSNSLSFRHINADQGLTAGYNWYMRHDSRGYLWISSLNGVFRFDGLSMKHYAPDNANGIGIKGANIQSDFFEDNEGNIWFSTYEAINKYVRETDTFESYQCTDARKQIADTYCVFYLEKDSLLWLRAGDNIFTYNIKTHQSHKIIETNGRSFSVDTNANGQIQQIFVCSILEIDPFEIITIKLDGDICKEEFLQNGINNKALEFQYALKQQDTLIWILSDQGLLALNPYNNSGIYIYQFPQYNNQKFRKAVFMDAENLLITTDGAGIWQFNTKKRNFIKHVARDEKNKSSLFSNNLWGINKDTYNQLWISQYAGASVNVTYLKRNQFNNPFINSYHKLPNVNSIIEDSQGLIWCSTVEDGIFIFDKTTKLIKHFPYNPDKAFNNIRQLSKDSDGTIWALGRKGLFIFDLKNENWKKVVAVQNNNLSFMAHLSPDLKIISSTNGMMELHNPSKDKYLLKDSPTFNTHKKFAISQLLPGKNNLIYAPLEAKKIIILSKDKDNISLQDTFNINTEVNAIWEEPNKPITWLGTSNGLWHLDREAGIFQKHELRKGELIAGQVWGVLGDNAGQLWVAADNGLWCYSFEKKIIHFFGRVDELQVSPFSRYANLRASDGKIWLGTNDGLLVFDPAAIRPFPQKPRVGIQSLKVNDIPYEKDHLVNIDELTHLKLPYYQNTLKLGLIAITQYLPESSIIKYRLHNQEKEWTWIKNGEVIHLFNLPANKYKLEMVAYNANNVSGVPRTLQIDIEPPFWQKWWFKALVAAATIGAIWGIIGLYVRRRLRKQQIIFDRQQALQEERNRIAAELHDDMGAGLSTIRFLSHHLLQTDKDTQTQENIQSIYESSGALFENMRDIIWATNVENDTLESLLFYIQSYTYNFLNTNQLECEFELPAEIPVVELGGSWRRNVLLAVKEALHNIVKHAWATRVVIQIKVEAEMLQISIQDDGIGLDENKSVKL